MANSWDEEVLQHSINMMKGSWWDLLNSIHTIFDIVREEIRVHGMNDMSYGMLYAPENYATLNPGYGANAQQVKALLDAKHIQYRQIDVPLDKSTVTTFVISNADLARLEKDDNAVIDKTYEWTRESQYLQDQRRKEQEKKDKAARKAARKAANERAEDSDWGQREAAWGNLFDEDVSDASGQNNGSTLLHPIEDDLGNHTTNPSPANNLLDEIEGPEQDNSHSTHFTTDFAAISREEAKPAVSAPASQFVIAGEDGAYYRFDSHHRQYLSDADGHFICVNPDLVAQTLKDQSLAQNTPADVHAHQPVQQGASEQKSSFMSAFGLDEEALESDQDTGKTEQKTSEKVRTEDESGYPLPDDKEKIILGDEETVLTVDGRNNVIRETLSSSRYIVLDSGLQMLVDDEDEPVLTGAGRIIDRNGVRFVTNDVNWLLLADEKDDIPAVIDLSDPDAGITKDAAGHSIRIDDDGNRLMVMEDGTQILVDENDQPIIYEEKEKGDEEKELTQETLKTGSQDLKDDAVAEKNEEEKEEHEEDLEEEARAALLEKDKEQAETAKREAQRALNQAQIDEANRAALDAADTAEQIGEEAGETVAAAAVSEEEGRTAAEQETAAAVTKAVEDIAESEKAAEPDNKLEQTDRSELNEQDKNTQPDEKTGSEPEEAHEPETVPDEKQKADDIAAKVTADGTKEKEDQGPADQESAELKSSASENKQEDAARARRFEDEQPDQDENYIPRDQNNAGKTDSVRSEMPQAVHPDMPQTDHAATGHNTSEGRTVSDVHQDGNSEPQNGNFEPKPDQPQNITAKPQSHEPADTADSVRVNADSARVDSSGSGQNSQNEKGPFYGTGQYAPEYKPSNRQNEPDLNKQTKPDLNRHPVDNGYQRENGDVSPVAFGESGQSGFTQNGQVQYQNTASSGQGAQPKEQRQRFFEYVSAPSGQDIASTGMAGAGAAVVSEKQFLHNAFAGEANANVKTNDAFVFMRDEKAGMEILQKRFGDDAVKINNAAAEFRGLKNTYAGLTYGSVENYETALSEKSADTDMKHAKLTADKLSGLSYSVDKASRPVYINASALKNDGGTGQTPRRFFDRTLQAGIENVKNSIGYGFYQNGITRDYNRAAAYWGLGNTFMFLGGQKGMQEYYQHQISGISTKLAQGKLQGSKFIPSAAAISKNQQNRIMQYIAKSMNLRGKAGHDVFDLTTLEGRNNYLAMARQFGVLNTRMEGLNTRYDRPGILRKRHDKKHGVKSNRHTWGEYARLQLDQVTQGKFTKEQLDSAVLAMSQTSALLEKQQMAERRYQRSRNAFLSPHLFNPLGNKMANLYVSKQRTENAGAQGLTLWNRNLQDIHTISSVIGYGGSFLTAWKMERETKKVQKLGQRRKDLLDANSTTRGAQYLRNAAKIDKIDQKRSKLLDPKRKEKQNKRINRFDKFAAFVDDPTAGLRRKGKEAGYKAAAKGLNAGKMGLKKAYGATLKKTKFGKLADAQALKLKQARVKFIKSKFYQRSRAALLAPRALANALASVVERLKKKLLMMLLTVLPKVAGFFLLATITLFIFFEVESFIEESGLGMFVNAFWSPT